MCPLKSEKFKIIFFSVYMKLFEQYLKKFIKTMKPVFCRSHLIQTEMCNISLGATLFRLPYIFKQLLEV